MLKTKIRNGFQKHEQITLLETKLDDLEQYTRKFNLEICGIPEDEERTWRKPSLNYRNA